MPVEVDVDTDPELQAEYGDRVPVVLLDGREHSYFTVDVDRLRRDLRADRPPSGDPRGPGYGGLHHSRNRPGRSAGRRSVQRLCSCVHKRLPWRTRTFHVPSPCPFSDVPAALRCLPADPAGPLWRARDPATAPDHPGGHRRTPGRVPPGAHDPGRRWPRHGGLRRTRRGRRREPRGAPQGPVPPRPLRRARRGLRGRHAARPDRPRPRRRALPAVRPGRHRQPGLRRSPTTPASARGASSSSASSTPPPRGWASGSAG